jgi:hypothetical protein
MNGKKLGQIVLLLGVVLVGKSAFATTYYVDFSSGNDSYSGTSKSDPWQHAPGMYSCTANCGAADPQPGDSFIFKGGVTWPNASFPITWKWSGTSSAPIYIGVDKTWYTGSSWTRPIWDAGGAPMNNLSSTNQAFVNINGYSYVIFDNFEMKGFNWNNNSITGGCIGTAGSTYITVENVYVHRWTHTGSATASYFNCFYGDTNPPFALGSLLDHVVFDGSDSTNGGDSGAFTYAWPSVKYCVIHNTPNALLLNGHGEVAYNLIYNIMTDFGGGHENAIEPLGGDGTLYVHDNVIHDIHGEAFFAGASPIVYAWNNLWYNLDGNPPGIDARYNASTDYYFNNTIVPKSGGDCFNGHGGTYRPTVIVANNHCITTNPSIWSPTSNYNVRWITNILMSPTTAARQGYTSSETYAFSPAAGTNSTVGAGTNLTSSWPSGYSTNDTTYACTEQTIFGVVQSVCPTRTAVARPSSGAWDVGAYAYILNSGGPAPRPPTGLRAVVQ